MADGSIVIDTRIDQSGADEGLSQLQSKLGKSGDRLKATGKTLSTYITAPLIGAGIASAKFAMDQEAAFAKVSTLLTGSAADYQKYKDQIRQASSDMGVSFDEYSESVYGAISAGIEQGKAIEFTGEAVKLAKGGFTDTATAVDLMTGVINAYGMEAEDATRISDILINTQNKGKLTVDELAASMGTVIPIAKSNNVAVEELSSVYAVLTKNSIGAAEAGTYMKSMFGELGKSGTEVDKILREKTGKGFAALKEEGMNVTDVLGILQEHADDSSLSLSDLFGSAEAGTAALTLMGDGGEDFNAVLDSMGESAGATEDAFRKISETTREKMAKAFVNLKNALADFGDLFLPMVAKVIEVVARMVEKFMTLSPAGQKIVAVIAAIVAAIGPFLMVAGMMVSLAGSIAGVFASAAAAGTTVGAIVGGLVAPFAIALGAFAALIAIGVLLYKNWDTIKEYAIRIWTAIGEFLTPMVRVITEFIMSQFNKVRDWWMQLWPTLKQAFMNIWNGIVAFIKPIINGIVAVFKWAWPFIEMLIISVWKNIKGVISGALNIIMGAISAFANLFTGNWKGLWESVKQIIGGALTFIWNFVQLWGAGKLLKFFTRLGGKLVSSMKTAFTNMKTAVTGRMTAIKDSVKRIWGNVMDFFKSINLFNMGKDIIQGLINGIKGMAGSLLTSVKKLITDNIPGPIAKILDLASPSKLMKQYGEWTGEGLEIGINHSAEGVEKSSENLASAAIPNMKNLASSYLSKAAALNDIQAGESSNSNKTYNHNNQTTATYNITIPAKDIQEFNNVTDFFKRLPQTFNAY